jgi:hypothetical protein
VLDSLIGKLTNEEKHHSHCRVLLFALVAAAQEVPRYETSLGYTYIRANQNNNNAGLGERIGSFDMNGGSGQFIYNFNKF